MKQPKITIVTKGDHGQKIGPLTFFRCSCCHKVKATDGRGCSTGYAVTPNNRLMCYTCADAAQREELRDTSRPFFAYLAGNGRNITTWTGGELMRVERETGWRIFGSRRNMGACVTARDVHGKRWYGRGAGRGMCIKLRACKN